MGRDPVLLFTLKVGFYVLLDTLSLRLGFCLFIALAPPAAQPQDCVNLFCVARITIFSPVLKSKNSYLWFVPEKYILRHFWLVTTCKKRQ